MNPAFETPVAKTQFKETIIDTVRDDDYKFAAVIISYFGESFHGKTIITEIKFKTDCGVFTDLNDLCKTMFYDKFGYDFEFEVKEVTRY